MEGVGLAHLYPALAWSVCAPGHHGYPLEADQMQGVLARIDPNGVCDCSGCLMGQGDALLVLLSPRGL